MNILVFEQLMSTIDFHRRKTILWMSMVLINCLDNKHFQNVVCVQQDTFSCASAENESELLDCDDAIFLTSSDSAASALLGYAQ